MMGLVFHHRSEPFPCRHRSARGHGNRVIELNIGRNSSTLIDFGARAGYDWQMGRLVVGAVGELGFPDHLDSVAAFSTTPAFYTFTRELDWLGGLRGRAGFGGERVLVYGSGGADWAKLDYSFATNNTVNTFVESEETMSWGYQVGGGLEIKFGGRDGRRGISMDEPERRGSVYGARAGPRSGNQSVHPRQRRGYRFAPSGRL